MARKYKRRKGKAISKAGKKIYKGVEYRSGLEAYMAKCLTEADIDFKYEQVKYTLMEGFTLEVDSYERQANAKGDFINRGNKKVQPIRYTPDFVGCGFIIETKGFANEGFSNRWKMFKRYVYDNNMNDTIYKPQNQSECDKTVKLILSKRK